MQLSVNGETREITAPDLPALVDGLRLGDRRIAVELNGEIVPRSTWGEVRLKDGDRLEIVQAIGGG